MPALKTTAAAAAIRKTYAKRSFVRSINELIRVIVLFFVRSRLVVVAGDAASETIETGRKAWSRLSCEMHEIVSSARCVAAVHSRHSASTLPDLSTGTNPHRAVHSVFCQSSTAPTRDLFSFIRVVHLAVHASRSVWNSEGQRATLDFSAWGICGLCSARQVRHRQRVYWQGRSAETD